jgi:hypothetical protein
MDSIYKNYPLNAPKSVRLLVPETREEGGLLSYRFTVKNLDQDTRYIALSYVWGDPCKSGSLRVEGERQGVTHNLLAALEKAEKILWRECSYISEPLLLWADQLCIDQGNLEERGSQVSLMGDIYSCAERVYVSLSDSDDAVDAAHIVTTIFDRTKLDATRYVATDDIPYISKDELMSYSQLNWNAFREMMLVPWFSRAWVVQETGLARHGIAMYGDYHFEWQSLMTVLGWLSYPGSRLYQLHRLSGWTAHQIWVSFDPKTRNQTNHFPAYNFLDLLSHAAYRYKATDARDYIFSLLSHPSSRLQSLELQSPLIQPDYTTSVGSVFIQFAIAWLERSSQAYLLACVNHKQLPPLNSGCSSDNGRALEIPSWCPRWDYLPLGGSRLDVETDPRWYNASALTEFRFRTLPGDQLEVRAILYDAISETFAALKDLPVPTGNIDPKFTTCSASEIETALKLGSLCGSILLFLESMATDGALNEQSIEEALFVFASTVNVGVCEGKDASMHKARQLANFKASIFQAQQSYAFSEEPMLSLSKPLGLLSSYWGRLEFSSETETAGFLQVAETCMVLRRLFLSSRGHIGLGPEIIMPGDVCCIISGANVPYIVRPFRPSTYLLIGECYVQDIMHGEAVGQPGHKWKDIVLE